MKVAVTGANGHVGVNLCRALIESGHEVTALIHKHTSAIKDIPVRVIKGDLLNQESLRNFLEGQEICFHLAAFISIKGDPHGMVWKINVDGTRNLIEASKEFRILKFIHFSSIHAFEQYPVNLPLDESRPLVTIKGFAYDRSKAEGERIVQAASSDGLDTLILNPTAIIGPADPEPSLTGKAILALYNRQIPALVLGGYDWVDVRDVVTGSINAVNLGRKGEKYLLSGHWLSLPDLSRMVARLTGKKTSQTIMPMWVARTGLPFITLLSRLTGAEPLYTAESLQIVAEGNRQITNEKAKRELDFNPRKLDVTIRDLFAWFKENNYIHYSRI